MSINLFHRITVPVGHLVLEYRNGQLSRTLLPGKHFRRPLATYIVIDTREHVMTVAPQEVLTSDTVSVRVTMAVRACVNDAVAYAERSTDPWAAVYLAAQVALRTVCAAVTIEELMQRGNVLDVAAITTATRAAGADVGIDVREVMLKDVLTPPEIRSAAMELSTAKTRGSAKLEVARAETAALRALANAGRVLEANPSLARLRLVQEAPYGTRLVLSMDGSDAPADDS